MEELLTFTERYQTKKGNVIIKGEIYKNSLGCYMVKFNHSLFKYNSSLDTKVIGQINKAKLPLNGSGKSKLKKKVERYIYSFYR